MALFHVSIQVDVGLLQASESNRTVIIAGPYRPKLAIVVGVILGVVLHHWLIKVTKAVL